MRRIVLPIRDRVSAWVDWTNRRMLDGVVNGAGLLARGVAVMVSWFDRTFIDGAVNAIGGLTGATGGS